MLSCPTLHCSNPYIAIALRTDYIGTYKYTAHTIFTGNPPQPLLLNLKYKENPFTSLENYTEFSQGQIHSTVDTSINLRAKYTELTAMVVTAWVLDNLSLVVRLRTLSTNAVLACSPRF